MPKVERELTPDEQEAIDENTPSDRLEELARQSTKLAALVAKNPNASANLLEVLANRSDVSVRQNLATNPNILPQILARLVPQYVRYVFQNPALDLLLLENPNLLNSAKTGLYGLLQHNIAPLRAIEYAANSTDEGLQLAVAMNLQASKTVLERLVQSQSSLVREAAKLHVNWSANSTTSENVEERVRDLLAQTDETFEEALAQTAQVSSLQSVIPQRVRYMGSKYYLHQQASQELEEEVTPDWQKLLETGNSSDLISLASNPSTPVWILEKLAERCISSGDIARQVALNPSTPVYLLQRLADSNFHHAVHECVALNPNTPVEILEQLASRSNLMSYVHEAIARNPKTPLRVLRKLSNHQDIFVRVTVANNPNSPRGLALELLEEFEAMKATPFARHAQGEEAQEIIWNPYISGDYLVFLLDYADRHLSDYIVGSTYLRAIRQIARHPNLPASVLKDLLKHKNQGIANAAAENPKIFLYIEQEWGIDWIDTLNHFVLVSLSRNLHISEPILEKMLRHQAASVQSEAAMNPCVSDRLLDEWQLQQDSGNERNDWQRVIAAKQILLNQWELKISLPNRLKILLDSRTPVKILAEIASSRMWLERWAIAKNPSTPKAIVQKLTQDANRVVREAAMH